MSTHSISKGPGRPQRAAEQDIRQLLLDAAAACLANKAWSAISIREVAAQAGTNSAMVSYYFGGKAGLVHALLDSVLTDGVIPDGDAVLLEAVPANERLGLILSAFRRVFETYPWLLRLIVDDLVSEDRDLREAFVNTLAGSSAAFLPAFIQLQQQDGYYRADIDVAWVTVTLLGLMAFPLLAMPILTQAYGMDAKTIHSDDWINHTQNLFENGLRADKEIR